MAKQPNVYTSHDFADLCGTASNTIKPVVLDVDDLPAFKPKQRARATPKMFHCSC